MVSLSPDSADYNIEYCHVYANEFLRIGGLSDAETNQLEVSRPLIDFFRSSMNRVTLSVLVDNYFPHPLEGFNPDEVYEVLEKAGLPPDFIFMERDMGRFADTLISQLRKGSLEERGDRLYVSEGPSGQAGEDMVSSTYRTDIDYGVLMTNVEDWSETPTNIDAVYDYEYYLSDVLLKYKRGDRETWSCPLLASVWYLARLGVQPYRGVFEAGQQYSDKAFFAEKALSLLPSSYLKVESASRTILQMIDNPELRKSLEGRIQYFMM